MAPDLNSLIQLLKADHQLLTQLESLLQQEQTALENRELDTLQELTSQKNQLLHSYAEQAGKRRQWMEKTGLPAERFLALLSQKAPAVYGIYQRTEAKLKRVHHLNEVNGRILMRTQQVNQRLMDILRGKAADTPNLYGKSGQKTSGEETHLLISA